MALNRQQPASAASVAFCNSLIRDADIVAIVEDGEYKGFLVKVDTDRASLSQHITHLKARAALFAAVEGRIADGEYRNPGWLGPHDPASLMMREQLMRRAASIPRVMAGRGVPLLSWDPTTNALISEFEAG